MDYCITQEQLADIMTKALKLDTFGKLRRKPDLIDLSDIE
jgi:hypothetical protein